MNKAVQTHLERLFTKGKDGNDGWQVIAEDGDLKVFKKELEIEGVVIDPLKATHLVTVSMKPFPSVIPFTFVEKITESDTVNVKFRPSVIMIKVM